MPDRRWRVAVLTTGRQDYGILRSTMLALQEDARFEPLVYAGGMHLSERFGRTIEFIRTDGVPVAAELAFVAEPPDATADTGKALQVVGAQLLSDAPDALLLVGDRSETTAAAIAAALTSIPIAHLHGGEESEGAIDNVFRHAITKLSQLHLVSHERYARRVCQMGEAPENVVVVGAPGLDHLFRSDLPTVADTERRLGRSLPGKLVLVTVHPTTLSESDPLAETRAIAEALAHHDGSVVITAPNSDHGGLAIRTFWEDWTRSRPNAVLVSALGDREYWGLMRAAHVMVGNSSSGLIEAPAIPLPVINVGDRQLGRLRGASVQDVPANVAKIEAAIARAGTASYREEIERAPRLFLRGPAAPRVVAALGEWLPRRTLRKKFRDVEA